MTHPSRIPPLTAKNAPLLVQHFFTGTTPSPLAAFFGYVPEIAETVMPFLSVVFGPSSLGDRLQYLVVLRMSARNGCSYCMRIYGESAAEAGLTTDEVTQLLATAVDDGLFLTRERAVLAFIEGYESAPEAGPALLAPFFRPDEIIALMTLAGTTAFLNRFARAMEMR